MFFLFVTYPFFTRFSLNKSKQKRVRKGDYVWICEINCFLSTYLCFRAIRFFFLQMVLYNRCAAIFILSPCFCIPYPISAPYSVCISQCHHFLRYDLQYVHLTTKYWLLQKDFEENVVRTYWKKRKQISL